LVSREALAQPLRTVATIDAVKFPPKAATQAHQRLRATLEETLAPKSWYLAQTSRPIADCGGSPECMAKTAEETNTLYVLRISGQKIRDFGYDITLDLFTTATGYSRSSHATCDFCDPASMSKIVSDTAVEMLTSVLKEEASLREKAKREVPTPAVAPAPSTPPPAALVAPLPPPTEPHHISWIPWSMIGVGALTMVYGGWCLYKDGSSTGSFYPSSASAYGHNAYASKSLGLGTLIGGGVVALAGGIWLFVTPSRTLAVSASPNHVALSLRF
jgi:hypothetical protein